MSFMRTVWIGVAFLTVWVVHGQAQAEKLSTPSVLVAIDATLSEKGDLLEGSIELKITNDTGVLLTEIPFWLYPNRFLEINPNLDDRMTRWIYPSGESPGSIEIARPVWNGSPLNENSIDYRPLPPEGRQMPVKDIIAQIRLPAPLDPGTTGTLHLDFRVKIPKRRGRFGRWRGVISLGGGWFPRPLSDLTGQKLEQPPDLIEADVRLSLPARRGAVLHDRVFPWNPKARIIESKELKSETVVLIVMDLMEVTEKKYDWGKAIHVHRELRKKKAEWKDTRGSDDSLPSGLPDLGEVDISDRLFNIVGNTASMVRELAPEHPFPDQLVLVDIPAWDRLVQLGPGPVIVSDRLWRIMPVEKGLWFHDLQVVRIVGTQFLLSAIRRFEHLEHRYVTADMVGSRLAKNYSRDVHKASTTVKEMIGFASFIPTIDNILYAPQVPFREAYSQSIEEIDLLRDEPWRFMNRLPRGKRILGKLEDLVGTEKAEQLVIDLLGGEKRFNDSLSNELGEDPHWFFEQWYGDYPRVNYRLGTCEDIQLGDGRIQHRVEIVREGEVIREPVTVRIIDEDDVSYEVTWDGDGRTGVVEWTSKAPIDQVEVDPHGRLVEAAELTADHPLADNYDHLSWRPPMLTRLLFWGDLMSGDPYIEVGFSLRRRYDVTNSIALFGGYTPRSYGGSIGYYRYFGPKRTLNSRSWFLGHILGVTRYRKVVDAVPELPEETRFAATAGSLRLVVGRDNRSYFYDPLSGLAFWASASYSLGQDDERRTVQVGRFSSNLIGLLSPAVRHTFALSLGVTSLVGNPAAAQLTTLSIRQILRGFEVDETYGRVGLYAVTEYRHTLFDAVSLTAPHMSWFDRFQGVLFLGGGTISLPSDYSRLFRRDRIYTEVGYGLRVHTLTFGVQQYILGLDFAYVLTPIKRQRELAQTDGTLVYRDREPFRLIIGIMQTF
ncbi:MAG: M1 family metallopeptidase [Proteobacteria bacterium]|nr:M1 family metallopeptidase [Pseudomonadota bacterium]